VQAALRGGVNDQSSRGELPRLPFRKKSPSLDPSALETLKLIRFSQSRT